MDRRGSTAERAAQGTWAQFFVWVVVGSAAAFGLVIFGTLAALPILGIGLLAATRPALRRSWPGVLAGIGTMSLYVAYVQRRGPGTICWHTANASGCDQYADPWPWLVVGVGLVALGFLLQGWWARALHGIRER